MHPFAHYALTAALVASAFGALVICLLVFRYGIGRAEETAEDVARRQVFTRVGQAMAGGCFAATAMLVIVALAIETRANPPATAGDVGLLGHLVSGLEQRLRVTETRLVEAESAARRAADDAEQARKRLADLQRPPAPEPPRPVPTPSVVVPDPPRPPAAPMARRPPTADTLRPPAPARDVRGTATAPAHREKALPALPVGGPDPHPQIPAVERPVAPAAPPDPAPYALPRIDVPAAAPKPEPPVSDTDDRGMPAKPVTKAPATRGEGPPRVARDTPSLSAPATTNPRAPAMTGATLHRKATPPAPAVDARDRLSALAEAPAAPAPRPVPRRGLPARLEPDNLVDKVREDWHQMKRAMREAGDDLQDAIVTLGRRLRTILD
jgi:hypothetical protein